MRCHGTAGFPGRPSSDLGLLPARSRVRSRLAELELARQIEGQCPAEWWGLRVDLRCLRAAVDRGGGVGIAGRVELGHGALGAVAELEPLIGIVWYCYRH